MVGLLADLRTSLTFCVGAKNVFKLRSAASYVATWRNTAPKRARDCMAGASSAVTRAITEQRAQGSSIQTLNTQITSTFTDKKKSFKFLKRFVASACFRCGLCTKTAWYTIVFVVQAATTI